MLYSRKGEPKEVLPVITDDDSQKKRRSPAFQLKLSTTALLLCLAGLYAYTYDFPFPTKPEKPTPKFVLDGIEQCKLIQRAPPHFKPADKHRKKNDRFVPGTKATILRNGTVWTGEDGGNEVLYGYDVVLDNGVVVKIGKHVDLAELAGLASDVDEVQLNGAWVTPGIVDMHSHLGVDPAPGLRGTQDTNSIKGSVQPWLRSLDGFDTHDEAFNGSIAGGITTMLVLPGSANAIGGTAYPFKPRWTYENTPQSMLVEPAFEITNGSWKRTHAWRHIKHACGENPSRVYGQTRLDTAYDFRRAYNEGTKLKEKQDRWCENPKEQTEPFPESLEWEPLADAIRGNVKVNIHCYQTNDLTDLVRISNEFKVPIAAFHHAHEAYLVPDLLKQAYGPEPPTVAIFATNGRYKREAWRGSEFAAKVLFEAGLNVALKSDHPVLNSRYLVYEAAQAHHFGLEAAKALSAVTTIPAHAAGLDHRVGYLRTGYDADVVVWDSFPLALGATPKQTYIDGIAQILNPHVVEKPAAAQNISKAGHWDKEAAEAVITRGDPNLRPSKSSRNIIFQDVNAFFLPGHVAQSSLESATVVVRDGEIACVGQCQVEQSDDFEVINLKGGSIAPGLITAGSYMGLKEIDQEKSTADGSAFDELTDSSDLIDGLLVHGVDGAAFDSKNDLTAYISGVTTAVTGPISDGLVNGLSYAFSTSALHPLESGAIVNPAASLYVTLSNSKYSVSTKLAVLRHLLSGDSESTELEREVLAVRRGERRLVVQTEKADVIAAVIRLKREVAPGARITILGGTESWLVAEDLAREDIGVVVTTPRSFPADWDTRRIIPGPPLSQHTLPSFLASHGVKVGLGIKEPWAARNTRYEAAWAYTSGGFSQSEAIDLVSTNLAELLGLDDRESLQKQTGWVAYEGDFFSFESRVRAIATADRVDLL